MSIPDPGVAPFRRRLLDAGWLRRLGEDGLYARSGQFESIATGVERLVSAAGAHLGAPSLRFPPLIATRVLERSGYPRSFPDLLGVVTGLQPDERGHAELLQALDAGADWTSRLTATGLALCSAACHPLYPLLTGTLPPGGGVLEVLGYCFRHEPSLEPTRMQCFRQIEFVRVGTADAAERHRDDWVARCERLLAGLGLPIRVEVANDAFFGRAGRLLASSQRRQALKLELLCPVGEDGLEVAIASGNCHREHFGEAFEIRTATGDIAHTACIGVGLERVALALLWHHGLDLADWPADVRRQLWGEVRT